MRWPFRVVVPTREKRGKLSVIARALTPLSIKMPILKSFIGSQRNSAAFLPKECKSSMKNTSLFSSWVRRPTNSPTLPVVMPVRPVTFAPISLLMILARVALPEPGGPT